MPNKLNNHSLSWVIISDIGCVHKKVGNKWCLQWNVRDLMAEVLYNPCCIVVLDLWKSHFCYHSWLESVVANTVQNFSHKSSIILILVIIDYVVYSLTEMLFVVFLCLPAECCIGISIMSWLHPCSYYSGHNNYSGIHYSCSEHVRIKQVVY